MWYKPKLQKINNYNLWKIESLLNERKRGGRTELYVKWMGQQKKFNRWVSEDGVKDV